MGGLLNKNITANNRRTSIRLDKHSWNALEEIAKSENVSVSELCSRIAQIKKDLSFTATIRAFIVSYYRIKLESKEADILKKTINFLRKN